MMKKIQVLALFAAMIMLQGCFEKEAPQCSDEAIITTVQELYAEHMQKNDNTNILAQVLMASVPKKILSIHSARAVAYKENIHLRSCKAEAVMEGNITSSIEYTVQLDEKNDDQFYIELDMEFIETLAQQGMMNQFMKNLK